MKITITLLVTLACALIYPHSIHAAAVPWIGVLSGNNAKITVPEGKILIFQTIGTPSFVGAIRTTITGMATGGIGSGSFSAPLTLTSQGEGLNFLANPIRLGPGMTITNNNNLTFTIHGIAMDTGDFFAAAAPVIRGLSSDSGQLAATIDSRTTTPTVTTGEVSTDLQNWTTAGVIVTRSQSNPRISHIRTATGTSKKFLRTKTIKKTVATN